MILTIDTSTDVTVVGIFAASDRLIAAECGAENARHGDILLPRIRQVLEAARLSPASVTALAVGVGPGSFTGLRIGLATAQGWALAMGVPAYGVVSTEALAWPWLQCSGDAPVVVVSDAFKGEVAVAIYEAAHCAGEGNGGHHGITTIAAPYACSPAAALERISALAAGGAAPVMLGGGLRRYEDALTARLPTACNVLPPSADIPLPEALAALAKERSAGSGDPRTLLPLYVRDADAKLPERPLKL